jgi:spermidine/putrescine transport system ATP-binding protein
MSFEPTDGHIVLQDVTKRFGENAVVKNLDLAIQKGEFFTMLGPSGCGKTTTLRMIAGFEEPSVGSVWLEGKDVTALPAAKRPVNMVFQAYALFPHMSVWENVAFGLKIKRTPRAEVEERVGDAIRSVRLEGLEKRKPVQLSGGQQQRVALARALVNKPAALLLDEPLGALDLKLRKELQLELKHIQERTETTFVYVTHDQEEALTMSDRIAVMDEGVVEQVASPRELYEQPATPFVAGFIGVSNVLHLNPDARENGLVVQQLGEGEVLRAPAPREDVAGTLLMTIRPEKIKFADVEEPASRVSAKVTDVIYLGSLTQYIVELRTGDRLVVHRLNDEARGRQIAVGDRVTLHWQAEQSFVLGASDELAEREVAQGGLAQLPEEERETEAAT